MKIINTRTLFESDNTALMVYLNPASEFLSINYKIEVSDIGMFEVYNLMGEKIITLILNSSEGEQKLSLSTLSSGSYLYKYTINNRIVKTDKLVIVK